MSPLINRRELLGGALASAFLPDSLPKVQFPQDANHRLAVSTYPFRSIINSPGEPLSTKNPITLQAFGASLVQQFGVFGIEPWSRHFVSLDASYLKLLKQTFDASGIRVVNIPCDAPVKPCGSAQESAAALDTWSNWVDAAAILGAPSIRVHAPPSSAENMTCAVQSLTAISQYGESKNIVINLENDDPVNEDPYRIVKIIQGVNSPFLRALPDFCNSMIIRNDRNENNRALTALFPHAFNISHVKDVEVSKGVELKVDVAEVFAIAKKAGYHGYFSIETESPMDPYVSTRQLIAAARSSLSQ